MITQKYVIIKDRIEIYKDFTINLLNYIIFYYLDKDSLSEDEDIKNHFNFCYDKVCDEFLEEEINFKDNNELREYFYIYYYNEFYKKPSKIATYDKFWRNIFEIDLHKNKNIISVLLEIYMIFDKSINIEKEKNILELI